MTPLPRRSRVALATSLLLTTGALAGQLTTQSAAAAGPTVLKVVGTTDVSDSGLIRSVIEPDFEKAHPEIDLQYTAQGTGAAIASAKTGAYSALLVHAASLENQLVGDGYSLEKYGRAAFWGDYVLVGPTADPAGVLESGTPSHDTAGAFEKIAAAGAKGTAAFVSRGGTPGTTVQEHAIWRLTSGVPLCTVAVDGGGGSAPISEDEKGTACASTDAARSYPSWYHTTAAGQAANITRTSACAATDGGNGSNCYTFTDRGTFKYLQDQGQAKNLTIVARDNAASAPGGKDLLVNSFHAYGINPSASFSGTNQVDAAAAKVFLDFLTSPAEQNSVGGYLAEGLRPAFIPSAAPSITPGAVPGVVRPGARTRLSGTVVNAVPGTRALSGVPVTLYAAVPGAAPRAAATASTDATGRFTFTQRPAGTTTYTVETPQLTTIEDPTLDPPFGDILQPASATLGTVKVASRVTISHARSEGRRGRLLRVTGSISPRVVGSGGTVTVFRRHPHGASYAVTQRAVRAGARSYAVTTYFPRGRWSYRVVFTHPGVVEPSASGVHFFRSGRR